MKIIGLILFLLSLSEIFFKEEFNENWESRWVESIFHEKEGKRGRFGWEAPPKFYHYMFSKGYAQFK
jgi:hypothetical protein